MKFSQETSLLTLYLFRPITSIYFVFAPTALTRQLIPNACGSYFSRAIAIEVSQQVTEVYVRLRLPINVGVFCHVCGFVCRELRF